MGTARSGLQVLDRDNLDGELNTILPTLALGVIISPVLQIMADVGNAS